MNVMALWKFGRATLRRFSVTNVASDRMRISFAPHLSTSSSGGRHFYARKHPSAYYLNRIPERIDWREKGAVGPVKNQGHGGCCWAFAAVAAVESLIKIRTGKLLCLSEQQLLDCVSCNFGYPLLRGYMEFAFEWIIKNGIVLQSVYPYTGWRGSCKCHRISPPAARISGYKHVPFCNEAELQIAVSKQPVAVAVNAESDYWSTYEGGILIKEDCEGLSLSIKCTDLNHVITLVGYDTTSDGMIQICTFYRQG